jgi:putative spermidine/putrescine transport system substrate-binding protein
MKRLILVIFLVLPVVIVFSAGEPETDNFEDRFVSLSWDEIVSEARGSEVYWYMWGGSESINRYVQQFVAMELRDMYDIRLEMVPVTDASVYVSKVLGEQQAGRTSGGSVDLVWINGENFRSMREAGLLFGPYADRLPNLGFVNTSDASVANDFGFPVDGFESPYGSAQMVMIYDSARVVAPPADIAGLLEWIRANPGRFSYPAPPDFTGSAFVRHVFYHVAGGYEDLLGPFNQAVFDEVATKTWELFNELEPYLWRSGRTYPESLTQQQQLFANREIDFDMSYNPGSAANLVSQGRYPESTRTFVFDDGTIGNTHYVAVPFNAANKAGALVVANFLMSPEAQYQKALPEVWGDLPVVSIDQLSSEWQTRFADLPRPASVLAQDVLQAHRIPELQSKWLEEIERGWVENVLQK